MKKSLTIALPMHNGETRLRKCVDELLDLASELTENFSILIIDDGSTDDTYEVAEELAARFPQVSVRRHRIRRGLGSTIEAIQRRVSSDVVIVHDGISPIDTLQIRRLWKKYLNDPSGANNERPGPDAGAKWDLSDLADLPAIHAAMESAHQRLLGFQLLRPPVQSGMDTTIDAAEPAPKAPTRSEQSANRTDIGRIPSLPRPNFLSALAEFAWGE